MLPPKGEPRRFTEKDLVQEKLRKKRTGYKLALPAITRGTLVAVSVESVCADPRKHGTLAPRFRLRHRFPCGALVGALHLPQQVGRPDQIEP